jgi:hypothetical protein
MEFVREAAAPEGIWVQVFGESDMDALGWQCYDVF